jgi:hypothetical protein
MTGDILDLGSLLALSPLERAELDTHPHGVLSLEEHCFNNDEILMGQLYLSFVAALEHADGLYRLTPDAFTSDHGPIRLVLVEVER